LVDGPPLTNSMKTIPSYSTALPADCPLKRPVEEPHKQQHTKNKEKTELSTKKKREVNKIDTNAKPTSSSRQSKDEQVVLIDDDDGGDDEGVDSNPALTIEKLANGKEEGEASTKHCADSDKDNKVTTMSKSEAIHSFMKKKALIKSPIIATKDVNGEKTNRQSISSTATTKKKMEVFPTRRPLQDNKHTKPVSQLKRPEPYTAPGPGSSSLTKPLVITNIDVSSRSKTSNASQKLTEEEYNELIADDDDDDDDGGDDGDSDSCSSLIEF